MNIRRLTDAVNGVIGSAMQAKSILEFPLSYSIKDEATVLDAKRQLRYHLDRLEERVKEARQALEETHEAR